MLVLDGLASLAKGLGRPCSVVAAVCLFFASIIRCLCSPVGRVRLNRELNARSSAGLKRDTWGKYAMGEKAVPTNQVQGGDRRILVWKKKGNTHSNGSRRRDNWNAVSQTSSSAEEHCTAMLSR